MKYLVLSTALALITGCGGGDSAGAGSGAGSIESPCDLTDAATVQSSFSGTVSEGVEGNFNNCDFAIEGGNAVSVSVFHFGDAGDWEGVRSGYEANRGGVTDMTGLGDAAYFPNDTGEQELVVRAGGEIFSVSIFSGFDDPSADAVDSLRGLAQAIADNLG